MRQLMKQLGLRRVVRRSTAQWSPAQQFMVGAESVCAEQVRQYCTPVTPSNAAPIEAKLDATNTTPTPATSAAVPPFSGSPTPAAKATFRPRGVVRTRRVPATRPRRMDPRSVGTRLRELGAMSVDDLESKMETLRIMRWAPIIAANDHPIITVEKRGAFWRGYRKAMDAGRLNGLELLKTLRAFRRNMSPDETLTVERIVERLLQQLDKMSLYSRFDLLRVPRSVLRPEARQAVVDSIFAEVKPDGPAHLFPRIIAVRYLNADLKTPDNAERRVMTAFVSIIKKRAIAAGIYSDRPSVLTTRATSPGTGIPLEAAAKQRTADISADHEWNDVAAAAARAADATSAAPPVAADSAADAKKGPKRSLTVVGGVMVPIVAMLRVIDSVHFEGFSMGQVSQLVDIFAHSMSALTARYAEKHPFRSRAEQRQFGARARSHFERRLFAVSGMTIGDSVNLLDILSRARVSPAAKDLISESLVQGLLRHVNPSAFELVIQKVSLMHLLNRVTLQAIVDRSIREGRVAAEATSAKPPGALGDNGSGAPVLYVTRALRVLTSNPELAQQIELAPFLAFAADVYRGAENLTDRQVVDLAAYTYDLSRNVSPGAPILQRLLAALDHHADRMAFKLSLGVLAMPHIDELLEHAKMLKMLPPINAASQAAASSPPKYPGVAALRAARIALHENADAELLGEFRQRLPSSVRKVVRLLQIAQQRTSVFDLAVGKGAEATMASEMLVGARKQARSNQGQQQGQRPPARGMPGVQGPARIIAELAEELDGLSVYQTMVAVHVFRALQQGGPIVWRGKDLTFVFRVDDAAPAPTAKSDKGAAESTSPPPAASGEATGAATAATTPAAAATKGKTTVAAAKRANLNNFTLSPAVQMAVVHSINNKLARAAAADGVAGSANASTAKLDRIVFGRATPAGNQSLRALFVMTRLSVVRRLRDNYMLHKTMHDAAVRFGDSELEREIARALESALL